MSHNNFNEIAYNEQAPPSYMEKGVIWMRLRRSGRPGALKSSWDNLSFIFFLFCLWRQSGVPIQTLVSVYTELFPWAHTLFVQKINKKLNSIHILGNVMAFQLVSWNEFRHRLKARSSLAASGLFAIWYFFLEAACVWFIYLFMFYQCQVFQVNVAVRRFSIRPL